MPKKLLPLNDVILINSDAVKYIDSGQVTIALVGEKAFGLACLPVKWTLPFFVISPELIGSCKNESNREIVINRWLDRCLEASRLCGFEQEENIYIRSSAVNESLEERGKYYTIPSQMGVFESGLKHYVEKTLSDPDLIDEKICVIVQRRVIVSEKGHLSNERRCYKEARDWQCEVENEGGIKQFTVNLRNWRKKIIVSEIVHNELSCNLEINLQNILRGVASWGKEKDKRLHFEWVWDGHRVHLVQVEAEVNKGTYVPKLKGDKNKGAVKELNLNVLKRIGREHDKKYNKIHNVYVYLDLDLPMKVPLYILEDQSEIKKISEGCFDSALLADLRMLVDRSLVIRMDIDTTDQMKRQMLPRTHEVRSLDDATSWLKEKACAFNGEQDNIAFIFHNFIPAESSAFVFAAPGERKVQIEALWGIPEGLYYNSHDKYIVDTQDANIKNIIGNEKKYKVSSSEHYKPYCIAPNKDGVWERQTIKAPHDWGSTIYNDEWVKAIARDSRRIAEYENSSISVMWFLGVPGAEGMAPVIPWFHENYEKEKIPRTNNRRKKTPYDKQVVIETEKDITDFEAYVSGGRSDVRQVLVRPMEDSLLRDKLTLRRIGDLVKKIDAVIMLEGATLSHAFYQLINSGATVHVENPFEKDVEKREFGKLVRDKIPAKIQEGGELVKFKKLKGEAFFRALREKLVEESLEVLDSSEHSDVLEELSDVLEVIDGMLDHLGVSFDEIVRRKKDKRKKSGGFLDGLILESTKNPSPSSKSNEGVNMAFDFYTDDDVQLEASTSFSKGEVKRKTDKRHHYAAVEEILHLELPLILESWEEQTHDIPFGDNKESIKATVKGQRVGSKSKIEVSIFLAPKQFDIDNL